MTGNTTQNWKKHILDLINSEDRFFTYGELSKSVGSWIPINQIETELESILIVHENLTGPNKNERLYASKRFYRELISEISFEVLSKYKTPYTLDQLRQKIQKDIATYLGLSQGETELLEFIKLESILSQDDRFVVAHKSEYDAGKNNTVGLKSWEEKLYKTKYFVHEIIRLLGPDRSLPLKSLLFKLNLTNFSFGFSKPYSIQTIQKLMEIEGKIFEIKEDIIKILPINERISLFSAKKIALKNFEHKENTSGLLIFYFIGGEFPVEEAVEYVNLRPAVYFITVHHLELSYSKILSSFVSLVSKISDSQIGNVYDWVLENFAVSFVIEDEDFLKLNFDKLMQEYSPLLNLDKNPGNLFRGIIEEKIREYESGKQQ